jgi:hypothetical protein
MFALILYRFLWYTVTLDGGSLTGEKAMPLIATFGFTCENCSTVFIARVAGQRFCCRTCSDEWWQAERNRAMAAYREQRQQQMEHAHE